VTSGPFDPRRQWYFPAFGLALTGLLALSEPSRMLGLALPERTLLAALNVFLPLVLALAVSRQVMASPAARLLPYWLWLALIGVFATVVSVPAFVAMEAWLGPADMDGGGPGVHRTTPTFLRHWPAEAWEAGRVIVPVWLLLNLAVRWSRPSPAPVRDGETDASERRGFIARIPSRLGNDIVWVRAEQHYVRVTTPLGADLLLCGFGRAVFELGAQGPPGAAIHRSHWVAWNHVVGIEVVDGEAICRLTTGDTAPISRRRVREVRATFDEYRLPPPRTP
jgi:hypothetical protein